jgi:hypothetical protein
VPEVTLPEGSVRCLAGDHLIERAGDRWRVFRVQDFVTVERLEVLMRDGEPEELVPEMPDGIGPAYRGPHLLLTAYAERFADRDAARAAITSEALGEAQDRVCRALAEFPAETTDVVRAR